MMSYFTAPSPLFENCSAKLEHGLRCLSSQPLVHDQEFRIILGYTVSPGPARACTRPCFKFFNSKGRKKIKRGREKGGREAKGGKDFVMRFSLMLSLHISPLLSPLFTSTPHKYLPFYSHI